MKKLGLAIIAGICCLSAYPAKGRKSRIATVVTEKQSLPADSALRYGKLDNGLTYYIRKNTFVPERADFYIAQNVGAILEEPSQRGLAHFLEHMAFNGTVYFPEKTLIDYLEHIGVKFGTNLNAYTGVDQTVYLLRDVPVMRPSTVDSCLLILRDWSDGILLLEDEIDKERAVIEEEWRTRDGYSMRMYEQILPEVYGSDKYADCLPIGNMDVVRNFEYSALKDYYRKWYRPDLQGIIVVGDIDPDKTEASLKKLFGDCKTPANAAERVWYPVSDNGSPIVVYSTDKEAPVATVMLAQKHDAVPFTDRSSMDYMRKKYIGNLIEKMVCDRLEEIMLEPENPFSMAYYWDGEFLISKTKDARTFMAACGAGNLEAAFKRFFEEQERIRRYGFTESELQRAKDAIAASYLQLYNERGNQKNDFFVQRYVKNFTDGEPCASIDFEYEAVSSFASSVKLSDVNDAVGKEDGNIVVWFAAPENAGNDVFPDRQRVLFLADSLRQAVIEPYVDDFSERQFVSGLPQPGGIATVNHLPDSVSEYILSNGVKVYVKPSRFKDDEVLFKAVGKGGMSLESKDDAATFKILDDMAEIGGLGDFNAIELGKQLSGKNVESGVSVGVYDQTVSGHSSAGDIETLLQLVYLQFTSVRRDDAAFAAYKARLSALLENREKDPSVEFADSIISVIYDNHPFAIQLKSADLEKADYGKGIEILNRRFANAANMRFIIVGNVDTLQLEPLLCKYLAVLPASDETEAWQNCGFMPVPGERYSRYEKSMENPKASVLVHLSGEMPYTLENMLSLSVLKHVLDIVYFEQVREESGGTYGVRTRAALENEPVEHFTVSMSFECEPAKVDSLMPMIYGELEDLGYNGPRDADLKKAKEYVAKVYADSQQQNSYWLGVIAERVNNGLDLRKDYLETLDAIDKETIRKLAAFLFNSPNGKEIIQIGIPAKQNE